MPWEVGPFKWFTYRAILEECDFKLPPHSMTAGLLKAIY